MFRAHPAFCSVSAGNGALTDRMSCTSSGTLLLVAAAQKGDQVAFEKLYALYSDCICRYLARLLGDDAVACWLTQQTFLSVWHNMGRFSRSDRFVSMLYREATQLARRYDYRSGWQRLLQNIFPHKTALSVSEAVPLVSNDEIKKLQVALIRVAFRYRSCLVLYLVEGFSLSEVVEVLGISEHAVCKALRCGMETLKEHAVGSVQQ